MASSSLIVKCPACEAKTKVSADSERSTIRCPRCKAEVPLVYAKAYTPRTAETSTEGSAATAKPELTKRNESPPPSRRERRQAGTNDFHYPDHAYRFIRQVIYVAAALVIVALAATLYMAWTHSVADGYQEYLKNIRESVAAHVKCRDLLKQGIDWNDEQKANAYKEIRGRIDFLLNTRQQLTVPPEAVVRELHAEEQLVRQQVADAERLAKASVPSSTPPDSNATTSPLLRRSSLGGPPPAPSERAAAAAPKAEPGSVVISLPGVTKAQLTSELLQLVANLADQPPGQATPAWAGDLLTIHVKPVANPATLATRLHFGRILYYSSNDRALTVQLSDEQSARLNDPARDPMKGVLSDLKQREDPKKIQSALRSLEGIKTLDRQAEICAALEAIVIQADLDQHVREAALKLLPKWAGRDCVNLLEKLLDDPSAMIVWCALDALTELKSVTSAAAIAKKWEKFEPSRVTRALITLGSGVESVVLPYLHNTSNASTKVEVCRVLQEVGTSQSLKPLLDVVNEKNQSKPVVDAAKEAMRSILDRK